jgi:FAD/FMN-containing dehydrogenase
VSKFPTASFIDELTRRFDPNTVSTDPTDLETYGRDGTRVYPSEPSALVRPRREEEVSELLRICNEQSIAVVPSGGRTGLAGGAVAMQGEIVLSLERMRALGEVDRMGETLVAQAGTTTQSVHDHAAVHGLTWPIDLASKGSCQIGGNIATNAGGVRVIRHGHTRNWVLGLKAVLADGTCLTLNRRLAKDNSGFDLKQVLVGSEGTLGVVTEASLKLTRGTAGELVMLFAVAGIEAALELLTEARRGRFIISAFEGFSDLCLGYVMQRQHVGAPFARPSEFYVLMAVEGDNSLLHAWLESVLAAGLVQDGTLGQDSSQARRLWAYRETISESLGALGFPHKNDVALPVNRLGAFYRELTALFRQQHADWQICVFGHLGDGSIHINAMKPPTMSVADFQARAAQADRAVFELVQRFDGSISAEHGIGLVKKPYLHYARSAAELQALKSLKATFDPRGILNPGKIF